jgi:predicted component of type VI protein secretion system
MNLVLRCIALNEQTMSQPLMGRFDERGGTLGRSDGATLTLPDPERRISRLQAQVMHRDGRYWLENLSDISPVLHNGHPVGQGMQVALRGGDELRISGYLLQAAFEDGPDTDNIVRGRNVIPNSSAAPGSKALTEPIPPNAVIELQGSVAAGMRSALEALLDRLNPLRLEALLGEKTLLERLWPMRRAVRRWELYQKQYDVLREEAWDRLQRSFGRLFRAANAAHGPNSNVGFDDTVRPDETSRAIAEHDASVSLSGGSAHPDSHHRS